MNLLGIVLVAVVCLTKSLETAPTACESPDAPTDTVCDETDYEAYRTCIEESRVHRAKRQAEPCKPQVVQPIVQTMEPFELLVPVQPLKVAQKPGLKNLGRTIIVQQQDTNQIDDDDDDDERDDVEHVDLHYRLPMNVTTVIRLTNIVNNTNNIHMPTTLNNTNVNNIHVYTNLTELALDGLAPGPEKPADNCCTAVRPKSCHTSTEGVRCKHRKFETCGPQCTAKVVHIQKRRRCNRSTGECQEKIAYVPQPKKPTCVYIDDWPYVVCGKRANMSVICAGCYDHYGLGYEAVHGNVRLQPQCYGCYDDAFETGPLYRRGPVLRPFYYHQPPCYLSGSCPDTYDAGCGYGCYGHDRIDPAWGMQPPPEAMDPFDPSLDPTNTIYYDPDDLEIVDDEPSNDWGVPTAKCAVVTDGSSITVKNCTDSIDHPFLAAPAQHTYYNKALASSKKKGDGGLPSGTTTAAAATTKGPGHGGAAIKSTVDPQASGSTPGWAIIKSTVDPKPQGTTTSQDATSVTTTLATTQGPPVKQSEKTTTEGTAQEEQEKETTGTSADRESTTQNPDVDQPDVEEDDTEMPGSGGGRSFADVYADDEDFA